MPASILERYWDSDPIPSLCEVLGSTLRKCLWKRAGRDHFNAYGASYNENRACSWMSQGLPLHGHVYGSYCRLRRKIFTSVPYLGGREIYFTLRKKKTHEISVGKCTVPNVAQCLEFWSRSPWVWDVLTALRTYKVGDLLDCKDQNYSRYHHTTRGTYTSCEYLQQEGSYSFLSQLRERHAEGVVYSDGEVWTANKVQQEREFPLFR